MIPKSKQISLYIYLIFLVLFSCQKKTIITPKPNASQEVSKLVLIADKYKATNKTDSAFFYFNKAKSVADPKADFKKITYSLLKMAEIQQENGDYIGSETTAKEALKYLNNANETDYTWRIYRVLGIDYFCIYNFENSILYYQKAYQLKTDKKRKIAMKNNIALVYREQKKYNKAIQIFETLLNEKEIKNNPLLFSKVLDNLGSCYTLVENPLAVDFLHKGLEIRLKLDSNLGLGMSYMHLSKFHDKSNPELAKKYAQISYEKYTKANCIDDRLNALELIIKNSNDAELKKNSILYIGLVDSIFEARQRAKNEYARIKYDSKKEKNENLKLRVQKAQNELQIERQKNRNIYSYIIIMLSLSLILVLYFYLTSKGNKDKIEATYKSETRISKKLHDELANDIYHTMAFAENRNLSIEENKTQLLNNLDAIYSRTRDISKENSPIITNENYPFYLKEMISRFNTPNIDLILNGVDSVPWNNIQRNKKIAVYRVLQELLVNMKKHSNATLIEISFKVTDKSIIVNYTDNGKGVDVTKMAFKNGLHNVESRILSIKGEIDIDSAPDKGFKVFFKFPYK
ncbi:ATP-binding protein [Flavobacterium sp. JLP]|uniref:tetratricopeptide repeat-containing sensor histidine kinase n=1 Tax=Flavobacterium sp. JLP TaxID=2783793 RepID=UPI00188AEB92|nr:tetratricopeptide repeat-containing sensor histidine kinase [Flavobacterium sp. JLP]MBF4506881.1 ATP-binding protein [Flavobacterium sp. JLP]